MADTEGTPDFHLAAYVTNLGKYNEGYLVGEWVKFPVTPDEMQDVFRRIGIGGKDVFGSPYEEWFITDYDCYIDGIYDMLSEYESLDELNYLADKLDEMSDAEVQHFKAIVKMGEHSDSVQDLINLTENLDCYEIYPDITDEYDLGYYLINELGCYDMNTLKALENYIDYKEYGDDTALNENGVFTDYGYVVCNQSDFKEIYNGSRDDIPDEYRRSSIPDIEAEQKDAVKTEEKKPSIRQQLAENKSKSEKTQSVPLRQKNDLSL